MLVKVLDHLAGASMQFFYPVVQIKHKSHHGTSNYLHYVAP